MVSRDPRSTIVQEVHVEVGLEKFRNNIRAHFEKCSREANQLSPVYEQIISSAMDGPVRDFATYKSQTTTYFDSLIAQRTQEKTANLSFHNIRINKQIESLENEKKRVLDSAQERFKFFRHFECDPVVDQILRQVEADRLVYVRGEIYKAQVISAARTTELLGHKVQRLSFHNGRINKLIDAEQARLEQYVIDITEHAQHGIEHEAAQRLAEVSHQRHQAMLAAEYQSRLDTKDLDTIAAQHFDEIVAELTDVGEPLSKAQKQELYDQMCKSGEKLWSDATRGRPWERIKVFENVAIQNDLQSQNAAPIRVSRGFQPPTQTATR